MLYSALSPTQQAQVTEVFHDEYFGKDVCWFDYHLDDEGNITTRARLPEFRRAVCRAKPRTLTTTIHTLTSTRPLTFALQMKRD